MGSASSTRKNKKVSESKQARVAPVNTDVHPETVGPVTRHEVAEDKTGTSGQRRGNEQQQQQQDHGDGDGVRDGQPTGSEEPSEMANVSIGEPPVPPSPVAHDRGSTTPASPVQALTIITPETPCTPSSETLAVPEVSPNGRSVTSLNDGEEDPHSPPMATTTSTLPSPAPVVVQDVGSTEPTGAPIKVATDEEVTKIDAVGEGKEAVATVDGSSPCETRPQATTLDVTDGPSDTPGEEPQEMDTPRGDELRRQWRAKWKEEKKIKQKEVNERLAERRKFELTLALHDDEDDDAMRRGDLENNDDANSPRAHVALEQNVIEDISRGDGEDPVELLARLEAIKKKKEESQKRESNLKLELSRLRAIERIIQKEKQGMISTTKSEDALASTIQPVRDQATVRAVNGRRGKGGSAARGKRTKKPLAASRGTQRMHDIYGT